MLITLDVSFILKIKKTNEIFSVPYEPCRVSLDKFRFSQGAGDITWDIEHQGLIIQIILTLPLNDSAEIWSISITNTAQEKRELAIYPYFLYWLSVMDESIG